MLVTRTKLLAQTKDEIAQKWKAMSDLVKMHDLKKEIDNNEKAYPAKKRVEIDVLGIKHEIYIFYEDDFECVVDDKKVCGHIITAVEDRVFDNDPMFAGEMKKGGIEFVAAEIMANFLQFGVKNFLSMVRDLGVRIASEDFLVIDDEVDEKAWFAMKSWKTNFLVSKESVKGLNIPKIRSWYAVVESEIKNDHGMGMEVKNMDENSSFDDFKRMMGGE